MAVSRTVSEIFSVK